LRVLIVDDSRSSLAFLTQTVSQIEGCEAESFLEPPEALARCGEVQFDLLLVDNVMPEIDGLEVMRRLRSIEGYRLVPIIMVTSDAEPALRLQAIAAGATDFLHKPFDPVELQARARNLLALRKRTD
jgi:putative two-component system response regulator